MPFIEDLTSFLNKVEHRSDDLNTSISAILLHIRATEMAQQKRRFIIFSILMATGAATVIEIGRFLAYPVLHTKRFLIALGFSMASAFIAFYVSESIFAYAALGYIAGYFLSSPKRAIQTIRNFLFDIADVFSLGTCTKLFAKVLAEGGSYAAHRALTDPENDSAIDPLAVHFYISRHPVERIDYLRRLEDTFNDLSSEEPSDYIIEEKCREYWESREKFLDD